jgi:hypothetical protein
MYVLYGMCESVGLTLARLHLKSLYSTLLYSCQQINTVARSLRICHPHRRLLQSSSRLVSPRAWLRRLAHECEHQQQVIPTPTRPRTLLSKQLYYGSTRCDAPYATLPCVQQQQVIPAPAVHRILCK